MSKKQSLVEENEDLRRKLLHARGVITELQDELKEQETIRYNLTKVIFSFPIST